MTTWDIILPDDEKDGFEYFMLVTLTLRPMQIAMVKFPATLKDAFAAELEVADLAPDEGGLMWYLTERRDEADDNGENAASRYELRGSVYTTPDDLPPKSEEEAEQQLQDFKDTLDRNSKKDGYVYLPKALRDGRHEDQYILKPVNNEFFTTRTERGMFEEVAWSPFGTIDEATKQEAQNLERNPLMRNWQ
jgi:hypothetical protein